MRSFSFFFFNDTATTEIYTLSLHDALPISDAPRTPVSRPSSRPARSPPSAHAGRSAPELRHGGRRLSRSGEHTSELQSRPHLLWRLFLGKKKKNRCRSVRVMCR